MFLKINQIGKISPKITSQIHQLIKTYHSLDTCFEQVQRCLVLSKPLWNWNLQKHPYFERNERRIKTFWSSLQMSHLTRELYGYTARTVQLVTLSVRSKSERANSRFWKNVQQNFEYHGSSIALMWTDSSTQTIYVINILLLPKCVMSRRNF